MFSFKELYERGVSYSNDGNYTDAIKCYDKALEIDAKNKEVWNAKGTALTNLGHYSDAMRCFDQASLLDPNYTTSWNSKAIAFRNQGKFEEAIKCHEKALSINPSNTTAINGIKKVKDLLSKQSIPVNEEKKIDIQPDRVEKTRTIIINKYALVNKITEEEAKELNKQTGIEVKFERGKSKAKFLLGTGQFSKLRLAKAIKTQEFLGVKKIKGDDEIAASEQEAAIQMKFKNIPNIMPLLDSCLTKSSEGKGALYQFMPLASFGNGDSLRDLLNHAKNASRRDKVVLYVLKGLLLGLQALHKQHVYHLDLKPANMVFKPNGELFIIDFGCAVESANGMIGPSNGDSKYIGPDRFAAYKTNPRGTFDGAKADTWALGVTVLELAIGRYPFGLGMGFMTRVSVCDAAYYERTLSGLTEWQTFQTTPIGKIVKGLLETDPKKRLTIDDALKLPLLQQDVFQSAEEREKIFTGLKSNTQEYASKEDVAEYETLSLPREQDENYDSGYQNARLVGVKRNEKRVEKSYDEETENPYMKTAVTKGYYQSEEPEKIYEDKNQDDSYMQVKYTSIPWKQLTIEKEIGKGAFGKVSKGKYQHGEVAIKELMLTTLSKDYLHEFQREAKIMAQLRHPHVVQFFGVCTEPGHYALVMEYVPKGSLYNLLHSNADMRWQMRMQIAIDMGAGLAYLHSQDILHRDLKSLNVLITNENRAKLTDFGLSKVKDEINSHSKDGASIGSTLWMAPELFEDKAKHTKESDVYSYGITLWEIASRKKPYSTAQSFAVPKLVSEGHRDEIPKDTPKSYAALISKCWAQRREERPTAEEAIKELSSSGEKLFPVSSKGNLVEQAPKYRDNLSSLTSSNKF